MKSKFEIEILTPYKKEKIENITFFRAEDRSGSFGILPNHTFFLTTLTQTIAIVKKENKTLYIALNKGVLIFDNNFMKITTRDFIIGDDLDRLKFLTEKKFKKIKDEEIRLKENISVLKNEFIKRVIEIEKE